MRCASAIGLVLALAAPTWAAAAVHITETQTIHRDRPFDKVGGARFDGSDFSVSLSPSGTYFEFDKFDLSKGVLVGANRSFDGTVSLRSTIKLDSTFGEGLHTIGQTATSEANVTFGAKVPLPTLSTTVSCTTALSGQCSNEVTKTVDVNSTLHITDPFDLKAMTGDTASAITPKVTVEASNPDHNGMMQAESFARLTGDYSLNYEYMDHANASFSPFFDLNTLTLDFGTVFQGGGLASKVASISNLGDLFTVGLDLDSIVASGPSPFSLGLSPFTNLGPGGQNIFQIDLDSAATGVFAVDYVFNFSDADVGIGLKTSQLTLRLTGVVQSADAGCGTIRACPTSPTPEPSTWAVMVLGFGAVGAAVRRRRPSWRPV
jgi:hypothetical protein